MKANLFTTYFISDNKERQKEYDYTILKNLDVFDTITILFEDGIAASMIKNRIDEETNAEVHFKILNRRPTFDDFFAAIKDLGKTDEINIIANSDIVFDKMSSYDVFLNWMKDYPNSCLALSRWDYDEDLHKFTHFNRNDSQDVWVFYGVPEGIEADFLMGMAGCDNRLAYEIGKAGYKVLNPSVKFKTYHIHITNYRTNIGDDGKPTEFVPQPYSLLTPY